MNTIKQLALTGALLLCTPQTIAQVKTPDIPDFKRAYVADTKVPFVTAEGPMTWTSRDRIVHNSPARLVHELRGYINIPIKIFGIEQTKLVLGVISQRDSTSIESIIYANSPADEELTAYDIKIAKREAINTSGLTSLWHERYDFANNTITNLETGKVQAMDDSREFQNLYFDLPKDRDLDTLVTVHYRGNDYPINIEIRTGVETVIEADLTYPDPKNPKKRKELIEGIVNISVHVDEDGLPYKMVAGARVLLDYTIYPEAKYDPKK